jgi:hypothetical protein
MHPAANADLAAAAWVLTSACGPFIALCEKTVCERVPAGFRYRIVQPVDGAN